MARDFSNGAFVMVRDTIFNDDSQVIKLSAQKQYGTRNLTEVTVTRLSRDATSTYLNKEK